MTTVVAPMCVGCRHLSAARPGMSCDAFPDGIPESIFLSKVDHRQPVAGDNGIRFEPVDAADAGYAAMLFSSDAERGGPQNWTKGQGGLFTGSRPGGILNAPTDMSDFPPEAQAAILASAQKIADYGEAEGTPGFPTTEQELVDETLQVYDRATPEEIAAGEVWYQTSHDHLDAARTPYGYSLEQACAVTARCSPRRRWTENEPLAALVMKTTKEDKPFTIDQATYDKLQEKPPRGPGVYRPSELAPRTAAFADPAYDSGWVHHSKEWTSQVADSMIILRAGSGMDAQMAVIDKVIAGPKIRNFYNNLHDPTDPVSVTIDSLQVRVMTPNGLKLPAAGKRPNGTLYTSSDFNISYLTGRVTNVKAGLPKSIGLYPFFAGGMQAATRAINARRKKLGQAPLLPQQMQAITWLVQQREGNQVEND